MCLVSLLLDELLLYFCKSKIFKEVLCVSCGALKLSTLPESGWLALPDCVHIIICLARAVVSWAFVSVGFTLWRPGTIPMLVFSCSKYFRRRSQAEIFFRTIKTMAGWFLYPEFYVTLFRFPFSPSFTWQKKKSQIWDLYENDCFFNYDVS